jgi:hypothetical protein
MPRGGARPNTGGKRPGAGRKPSVRGHLPECPDGEMPLEYLLKVMRDPEAEPRTRLEAAKIAAPFLHAKPGADAGGKKEQRQDAAEKVATGGKFAPAAPPRLIVNNT